MRVGKPPCYQLLLGGAWGRFGGTAAASKMVKYMFCIWNDAKCRCAALDQIGIDRCDHVARHVMARDTALIGPETAEKS
jgi:hypothetical protein